MEWLSILGELKCNYKEHTLQFDWEGESIKLTIKTHTERKEFGAQLLTVVPMWMELIVESYKDDQETKETSTGASLKQTGPKNII